MEMGRLFSNAKADWLVDAISKYRFDKDHSMIKPAFGKGSISDMPGFFKRSLGLKLKRSLPGVMNDIGQEVDHMVFFLLDGFGHSTVEYLLENHRTDNLGKFLEHSDYTPVTSVFPSTTSTSTMTYQTDLHPVEHGIIGYISYLSELGTMCNMITLTPIGQPGHSLLDNGWNIPAVEENGTIYEEFNSSAVDPYLYLPGEIRNSGMTRISGKGGKLNAYVSVSQMLTRLRKNIGDSVRKSFHFCYIPNVDTISHKVGPYTEDTAMEIESIFHLINEQFADLVAPDGNLGIAVSADHGHTVLPRENVSDVRKDRILSGMLRTPVGGDFRAPVLRIKNGLAEQALDQLEKYYGENYLIKSGKDAIREGFYGMGTVTPGNSDRFGDFVLFPKKSVGLMDTALGQLDPKLYDFNMVGMHGGLSEEEMIVPFITRYISSKK